MSSGAFSRSMHVLYVVSFAVFLMILVVGLPYYMLPVSQRPHSDMHAAFKPGGTWGHGLGIIGSAMILLLLTYSLRKKQRLGIRWGRLSRWLNVHVFFGIVGPLLITLHTAMKFNGIVSISFFAMVAVALSGFFGRYIYMQIPRDTHGAAMSLAQIDAQEQAISGRLENELALPADILARIDRLSPGAKGKHESGMRAILKTFAHDVTMPFRMARLRRYLRLRGKELSRATISDVARLAKRKAVLQRRLLVLNTMKEAFHLWHVIHLPFAYIMIGIMFLHITVTVMFGYRWIF